MFSDECTSYLMHLCQVCAQLTAVKHLGSIAVRSVRLGMHHRQLREWLPTCTCDRCVGVRGEGSWQLCVLMLGRARRWHLELKEGCVPVLGY